MKKLLTTVLAIAAFTVSVSAQQRREMKARHQKQQHAMMAKQLNFSEDQKLQAKKINADFRKNMQELNKNESITVKEMRDRKQAMLKERKAKMDGLLTAEQKNKVVQLKAGQKVKAGERYNKHLDKMKTNLGLSDDQLVKLRSQRTNVQSKMEKIKTNESLSREQKREQMMTLRTEAKDQRKKIFTPDQVKKMEELKKDHANRAQIK